MAAAPASTPAPSTVPKPGLKATMVGQGIVPPTAAAALGDDKKKMAFAATQPQHAATPPRDDEPSESKKFLPGDPMAPHTAPAKGHTGARASLITHDPGQPSNKTLIIVAIVGMLIIIGIGVGAAAYMGLVQFK
jgi:hypothetical protein